MDLKRSTAIGLLITFTVAIFSTPKPAPAGKTYGQLPLSFEPCLDADCGSVQFLSRGMGYSLSLTSTAAVVEFLEPRATLQMKLAGANQRPRTVGFEELPGKANYFYGNDPKRWRTNIPTYAKVRYQEVYPGIDLIYYGNQGRMEYDFVIAPGADPNRIRVALRGPDSIALDATGALVLDTAARQLRLNQPIAYQPGGWKVAVSYVLHGMDIGFRVGRYDRSKPLIIDPVLVYSTYLGGSGDENGTGIARDPKAGDIAVDRDGNAYITGNTSSPDFPTVNPVRGSSGSPDVFIVKLNAAGTAIVYSTYLGGSGIDRGFGIALDAASNAYVTGRTQSADFPTVNPLQRALGGSEDAFVVKLNATGSALLYSTYLGGGGQDDGLSIAVDAAGNAYVAGTTESRDRPTVNAFQPAFGGGVFDAYLAKLNSQGSALVYSTYLGGSGSDSLGRVAVDAAGNAYVTGTTDSTNFPTANAFQKALRGSPTVFVAKFNPQGSVVYSTYLGGSDADGGLAIAADRSGNAYVAGVAGSKDFPVTPGALQPQSSGDDVFVTKLDASGSALIYSTYLGGSGLDVALGIAIDSTGNAYLAGATTSTNFPLTTDAIQTSYLGGAIDGFAAELNAAGSALLYSSYLGGAENDTPFAVAVDPAGNFYLTGITNSLNFPVTSGAFQPTYGGGRGDAFVVKIAGGPPAPALLTTVSAASFMSGASLAPESIASAFAPGLAATTDVATAIPLPTSLGDTTVKLKDSVGSERLAPLFFVSPQQINYLIPRGSAIGPAAVTVMNRNQVVATGSLQIDRVAPGLFAANADGRDVAAAVVVQVAANGSQTSQLVFQCDARPGSCVAVPFDLGTESDQTILVLFGTGIRGRTGVPPMRVLVGNVETEVLYAGPQGDFIGLDQVNVRLPRSLMGRGQVDVFIMSVDGKPANPVTVTIK